MTGVLKVFFIFLAGNVLFKVLSSLVSPSNSQNDQKVRFSCCVKCAEKIKRKFSTFNTMPRETPKIEEIK